MNCLSTAGGGYTSNGAAAPSVGNRLFIPVLFGCLVDAGGRKTNADVNSTLKLFDFDVGFIPDRI